MSGHLVFIVGPSGSGKDSLINFARRQLPDELDVRFARRVITRPMTAGAEQHLAVSPFQFDLLRDEGEFVMSWSAHGEHFGIDREICEWLDAGATVIVAGSRHHLAQALEQFPDMTVVHVKASEEIRRARLNSCLRTDSKTVEARLQRGVDWSMPNGVKAVDLVNEGDLPTVGRQLVELIKSLAASATAPKVTRRTSAAPRAQNAQSLAEPMPRPAPRKKAAGSSPTARR